MNSRQGILPSSVLRKAIEEVRRTELERLKAELDDLKGIISISNGP